MSERPAPLTAERLAELRSYHDPCGWSCAAKTAGRPCETAQWLATLDATNEPEPPDARYQRLVAFAEKVATSENDTAGTRAMARFALTGSLQGVVDEMRVSASVDREEER